MFRIDDPSASSTLPAPDDAGSEGYFTEGNPANGTPATLLRASWMNMVQEELRNVVVAGGLTPSKTAYNQVLAAIRAIMNPQNSFSANGYYVLPNGLIMQWGEFSIAQTAGVADSYSFTLPTTFPNSMLQGVISPGKNIAGTSQPVAGSIEGWSTSSCTGYVYSGDSTTRIWRIFAIGH